eukprot:gene8282-11589_t
MAKTMSTANTAARTAPAAKDACPDKNRRAMQRPREKAHAVVSANLLLPVEDAAWRRGGEAARRRGGCRPPSRGATPFAAPDESTPAERHAPRRA